MAKAGRPSKFTPKMAEKIMFLAAKGFIDKEIAQVLDIAIETLDKWKTSKVFLQSLKESKESIDAKVRNSLLTRALGYDYEEEFASKAGPVMCQKKMHPDVTACIFWLKNRQPKDWREKIEVSDPDGEKNARTLIQIFKFTRESEQKVIEAGEDPMNVLFSKRFTATMEAKKLNGPTNGTTPNV